MGRASVTLRTPDGGAGCVDRSHVGMYGSEGAATRVVPVDVDQIGPSLSEYHASANQTPQPWNGQEAEGDVAHDQLWFDLPQDERIQFGSCFCRMLLKCLDGAIQEEGQV